MNAPSDPILTSELDAYVDGQLEVARRIEVEAHLAAHPSLASQVMADLQIRNLMRSSASAISPETAPNRQTDKAARRLRAGLLHDRYWAFARRLTVVAILVSAGWIANDRLGPIVVGRVVASTQPPDYVNEAIASHRTAQLRSAMKSQVETPNYDRDEVRSAMAIVMPELPSNWQVLDTQVFPSDFGPSVQMAISTEEFGLLSLYAVRPGADRIEPAVARKIDDKTTTAYWQLGEVAFVLVAAADVAQLRARASRFAATGSVPRG